ncbi:hypothetical protein [Tsukamurella paurometabola]|uniref:Uncharacterized protein n=1 Tax=Tsukamurella paurometabola TaxID=2061 RepID=A0ABS5NJW5_TSUPA|nr:hypothetical protein [Tsukamurella paurometabola]MBS4104112.1 hypothetical protein [Tsukamurella paurometabola]
MAQQRLQGLFLTIIGVAGAFGGVLFAIEAPKYTPVPVVFLSFWLVMVIVGQVLFAGLRKLRAAGVGAPAPEQVRAAAAVAAIVVAVGMMGIAATTAGTGSAQAAPCPGGGPATCGPTPGQPELTFTPPAGQQTAPGGQQGQQGAQQDNNGIATSPAGSGGDNGPGIQAQTPDFGTPGQPTPNIPGNEPNQPQPGQGQQQQQQSQGNQESPVQKTPPGRPNQPGQQQTQTGQATSSQPTVTVTKTQSECPAPGAAGSGNGGGPGAPGTDSGGAPGAGGGPDGGDDSGAPSWAYLVGETSALLTGRRRNTGGGGGVSPAGFGGGQGPAAPAQDTAAAALQQPSVGDAGEPRMETKPATQTYDRIIDPNSSGGGEDDGGASESVTEPVSEQVSEQVTEFEPTAGGSDTDDDGDEQQPSEHEGSLLDGRVVSDDAQQELFAGADDANQLRSLGDLRGPVSGTADLGVGVSSEGATSGPGAGAGSVERLVGPLIAEGTQPPALLPPMATPPEKLVPNPELQHPPAVTPAQSADDLVAPLIAQGTQPPLDDPTATILNYAGGEQISQGDGYPLTNPAEPIGVSDVTTPAAAVASGYEAQLKQSAEDAARRAATPGAFSPDAARDAELRAEEKALGRSYRKSVPIPRAGNALLTTVGVIYDLNSGERTVGDAAGNVTAATVGGIAGAALLAPIPGGAFVGGMLGSYAGGLIWDNKDAIAGAADRLADRVRSGWNKLFG